MEKAMFGAGCFWSVQRKFAELNGVLDTAVGYSGGTLQNPSYKAVCNGDTNHAEVCYLEFDSERIKFADLLEKFWQMHNPIMLNQQGPDIGTQYRSVIFHYSDEQRKIAIQSKETLIKSGIQAVTEISPAKTFWRAEEYHQHYFGKP